jgi:uncharacterized membrane protein
VTTPLSRGGVLRRFVLVAVLPALVVLLVAGDRLGGLLAVMWLVLVGTVAVATLSRGDQKPNPHDPRGRLHG